MCKQTKEAISSGIMQPKLEEMFELAIDAILKNEGGRFYVRHMNGKAEIRENAWSWMREAYPFHFQFNFEKHGKKDLVQLPVFTDARGKRYTVPDDFVSCPINITSDIDMGKILKRLFKAWTPPKSHSFGLYFAQRKIGYINIKGEGAEIEVAQTKT